jgi:signal transduction histidine kinase
VLQPDGQAVGFVKIARELTERGRRWRMRSGRRTTCLKYASVSASDLVRRNESSASEVRARQAAEAQIKSLFGRLVTIQEVERQRIARDIYDELSQAMTALKVCRAFRGAPTLDGCHRRGNATA